MFQLKDEIVKTIIENTLTLTEITNEEKESFIKNVYRVFVKNNPRALWLDFKYKAKAIEYRESPHKELFRIIPKENEIYFMIDDSNVEYYIYKGNIENIVRFIDECIGLDEYYIIYDNFTKLIWWDRSWRITVYWY